jgi:hypothetical protein
VVWQLSESYAFGGRNDTVITNNGSIKFDTAFSLTYDVMINAPARQAFVSMINTATKPKRALFAFDGISPKFIDLYARIADVDCC